MHTRNYVHTYLRACAHEFNTLAYVYAQVANYVTGQKINPII